MRLSSSTLAAVAAMALQIESPRTTPNAIIIMSRMAPNRVPDGSMGNLLPNSLHYLIVFISAIDFAAFPDIQPHRFSLTPARRKCAVIEAFKIHILRLL